MAKRYFEYKDAKSKKFWGGICLREEGQHPLWKDSAEGIEVKIIKT